MVVREIETLAVATGDLTLDGCRTKNSLSDGDAGGQVFFMVMKDQMLHLTAHGVDF